MLELAASWGTHGQPSRVDVLKSTGKQYSIRKGRDGTYGLQLASHCDSRAPSGKRYTHFISELEWGGPADECGLELGDCVLEVGNASLSGLSHSGAVSVLAQFDSSERPLQLLVSPPDATVKASLSTVLHQDGHGRYSASGSSMPGKAPNLKAGPPRRPSWRAQTGGAVVASSGGAVKMVNIGEFSVRDVGKAVRAGHYGDGVLRWVGKHHITAVPRVGVELIEPNGRNDGSVKGRRYFVSEPGHGVLLPWHAVELKDDLFLFSVDGKLDALIAAFTDIDPFLPEYYHHPPAVDSDEE